MPSESKLSGLYVITDANLMPRDRFVNMVEAAVQSGATMVQLREKNTPRDAVVSLGREVLAVTRRYNALLIVNDDPTVARDIGADGVHVGWQDPAVAETRAIVGDDVISGVSCYGELSKAVAAEQAGADYVAFGSPFPSPTKSSKGRTPIGIFQQAKQCVTLPIFAIGGINIGNAQQLIDAGADGVAVVSGVFGAPDVATAARDLVQLFQ
ncbi:MAG: thiamine phosphate synthase [bacterium]|nr:thiamine phosphate synthase [bacterium]